MTPTLTRVAALAAIGLSVAGCQEARLRQERLNVSADAAACASYGVKPGTDAYVACRMNRETNRAQAQAIQNVASQQAYANMMWYGLALQRGY